MSNFWATAATEGWFWKYVFSHLGWVDWVLLAFVLVGLILGLKNGLAKELPRLVEMLLALLVTFEYYLFAAGWLARETPLAETYGRAITFGMIWFLSWLCLRFVFAVVGKIVSLQVAAPFDALGGLVVGGARYFLFFCLVSYFLLLFPLDWIHSSYQVHSWGGQTLIRIPPAIYEWVASWTKGFLTHPGAL